MRRGREKQLARLAAYVNAPDDAAAWRAVTLRARVKVGASLRQALGQLGIDPATVAMLRICDEAGQELAMTADRQEAPAAALALADDRRDDGPVEALAARVAGLVLRDGGVEEIDFARAALAEVLGWCAARRECRASRLQG